MIKTLPITKAREELASLVKRAGKYLDEYVITVNGKPTAVIMSHDEYESWRETEEIMGDPVMVSEIKKAERELKERKGLDWEEVKKELKLDV